MAEFIFSDFVQSICLHQKNKEIIKNQLNASTW